MYTSKIADPFFSSFLFFKADLQTKYLYHFYRCYDSHSRCYNDGTKNMQRNKNVFLNYLLAVLALYNWVIGNNRIILDKLNYLPSVVIY